MLSISKNANKNYLAKIVVLKNLRKHSNADRLQCVEIDFQTAITGLDAKNGDIYAFFPVECAINSDFLSFTNSFRDSELNREKSEKGFFEKNGRVKAMNLRGEKSMGYLVPVEKLFSWAGLDKNPLEFINKEFDYINGKEICKKYVVESKKYSENKERQGEKPNVSRIIEGQVHLHTDTSDLRRNAFKIKPNDIISVTYKTHGTSWWVGNVLNKKKLGLFDKLLKKLGFNIIDTEYDLIYGSRRVVKNKNLEDAKNKNHFYGYDLWKDIKNSVQDNIPKGFTLYGECLGYDKNGGFIQKGFDYGCNDKEFKLEVYRITFTNPDGVVTELTYPQIKEFCDKQGLTASHLFYYGKAKDMYNIEEGEQWNTSFIKQLKSDFNEKDCFMCKNSVPEEGIIVRKEVLNSCESYKLKSFRFLTWESKENDKGETNIEDEN